MESVLWYLQKDVQQVETLPQIIVAPVRPVGVRDIDTEDAGNPQLLSDYINEIYIYLRHLERQQTVRKNYMSGRRH